MNANEERFEKKKSGMNTFSSERDRKKERVRAEWLVGVMLCWVLLYIYVGCWLLFCGSRKRRNDISTDTRL